MFHDLQVEIMNRFTEVSQHFRLSRGYKGDPSQTAKGLVFVQVYAIYEYAVRTLVRLAGESICQRSHAYNSLHPSLLALFLHPQFCAARDCGEDKIWLKRLELFDVAFSANPATLNGIPVPSDGESYRHTRLELILKVFGIKRKATCRSRQLYRIDEVVNHRHAIAHGEETAADIGRGYSRRDIRKVIQQLESVCLRLIVLFDEYCNDPAMHNR